MGIEAHQLLLFIAAGWLLNLTPGPDVLYIVSNALRRGTWAGIVATLGISVGCLVHVAAAAVGVGALLATSAMAFTVLKVVGAAYLLWMGVRMLMSPAPSGETGAMAVSSVPTDAVAAPSISLTRVFMGGFWTNVLNPKVVIFFLAFVPQFIAPGTANKPLAFVLLGVLFSVNAIPVNALWALAASWLARRAGALQRAMHWLDRAAGVMFIAFGLKLAFTDAPAA
ncbi:MAG: LysE family translocator [Burkholderiaceae bacterium]|nr:LysE family translocator [Burkholderiaceae bacterium]